MAILIAEDERVVAMDLRAMLRRLGYAVPAIVSTGAEAVSRAHELRPRLILMDIRLHGPIDGVQAALTIQERQDIPVIYLTAYADEETRERARQTRPYGYLVKPFDERTLQTTIEMALERHARDQEVRASREWLATTLRSIGDAIVTTDERGQVTFLNAVAERLLHCSQADALRRPISEIMTLVDSRTRAPITHPVLAALERGEPVALPPDTLLVTRDGAEHWIDDSIAPIRTAPETTLGVVMAFRDGSVRRRAEQARAAEIQRQEEARQRQRLRVLAGGIAHDLNNLLTSILGNAELIQIDLPGGHPAHVSLGHLVQSTLQAAGLTRQLLVYAGRAQAQRQLLDLNTLVRETIGSLAGTRIDMARLKQGLEPGRLLVYADEAQLRQVVMNLLINATEAIGESGRISVTTTALDATMARSLLPQLSAGLPPGDYIALEVADSGIGMDEATIARIFEPFYTTKFTGRGLGLALVQSIVQEHEGGLSVVSAPGNGSVFTVLLPCHPADAQAPAPAQVSYACARGTVLLIDDDAEVRSVIGRLLTELGFTVLSAAEGDAGLALYRQHAAAIVGVLLDLTMPGMTGDLVATELLREAPGLNIVLMSGYSEDEIGDLLAALPRVRFLAKPFTRGELQALVLHDWAPPGAA